MSAIDQYIELYKENGQAVCRNSAGALNEARREALALLAGASMPRKGDEDYEVTSLEDVFAPDYGVNVNRVELGANPAGAWRESCRGFPLRRAEYEYLYVFPFQRRFPSG